MVGELSSRLPGIRTPDRRLRVFVSSTVHDLADERAAAREAITTLHLVPVLFELGAHPHPPEEVYRAYLAESQVFVGIYWQEYGWVAPGREISGLEDELIRAAALPRLLYLKTPAPHLEPRLQTLLDRVRREEAVSYKRFSTAAELRELIQNDLALLLSERFETALPEAPRDEGRSEEETRPARPTNLPVPPTRLVGRDQEAAALEALIRTGDRPLVTLTGPGGSGKTRLALEVGGRLVDHFHDGVVFVPLAPLSDPQLVGPTIAAALDVRESAGRSLLESLEGYLRGRRTLLVLDNFEQVVEAAPLLATLLEKSPGLQILATSRTPLRIRGESEIPVPPLDLPDPRDVLDVHSLTRFGAVQLFVERAQAIIPAFTVTEDIAESLAEICRRLDGLPLALELAAARIRLLPPRELLPRLEHGLDILAGGSRDLPDRQRTLRAAIEWSYRLLDDQARTLYRRLAVFAGGWTLEAAESVCSPGDPSIDVLAATETLVDASLVVRRDDPDGAPRFYMLQTIREYASERLAEAPVEQAALRRRHADLYLALAETAEPRLRSAHRAEWLARLGRDYGNLQAALAWSTGPDGDTDIALRLAWALAWYWQMRGHITEGRDWVRRALARDTQGSPTCERSRALSVAGGLAWLQGDLSLAGPTLAEAVALGRRTCDDAAVAYALTYQGLALIAGGDPAGAQGLFEEATLLFRVQGERWGEAMALNWLGNALHGLGHLEAARERYEQSLTLWRDTGDLRATAMPLASIGWLLLGQDDLVRAHETFGEAVDVAREAGDQYLHAWALSGLGFADLQSGDTPAAELRFRESLARAAEVGNPTALLMALAGMAALAVVCNPCSATDPLVDETEGARAARMLGAAEALRQGLRVTLWHFSRNLYERVLATAAERVEPTTWERETSAGAAMGLQAAIAYAAETSYTPRSPLIPTR